MKLEIFSFNLGIISGGALNKENTLTKKLSSTNAILIYLSLFKLILLLVFAGNYGIFRDEYYYIETSKHLAFGYVDLQPLSAILLAISRFIFGDSIFGIRIFSYLAGSAIVFVTGLIARELGGSKIRSNFICIPGNFLRSCIRSLKLFLNEFI